jgi:hypothetical protein
MSATFVLLFIVSFILRCIAAALRPEPEPVPIPVYVVEPKKGKR